jgi:hypothetical protein
MPVQTTKISQFERLNPHISVNVYALHMDESPDGMVYPYRVYADRLTPVIGCLLDPETSSTTRVSKHMATVYAFLVVCDVAEPSRSVCVYRGLECIDHLLTSLLEESLRIGDVLDNCVPMIMTDSERVAHKAASLCYMCKVPYTADPANPKVRDHGHVSGLYRGSAHVQCTLKRNYLRR